MSTITTQITTDGYTKSIPIPNGSITAYVQKKIGQPSGIYVERKTENKDEVETVNMMFRITESGIAFSENNLESILYHLAKI